MFIPTSPEYSYLASSLVKEVAKGGGDVTGLVPDHVLAELNARFALNRLRHHCLDALGDLVGADNVDRLGGQPQRINLFANGARISMSSICTWVP